MRRLTPLLLCAALFGSFTEAQTMTTLNTTTQSTSVPTLTAQDRSLALIGGLTATGRQERLRLALNAGLDAGLTVNQIKEAQVQMYAYAGFPRSLTGLNIFIEVLEVRRDWGIQDPQGEAGRPVPPEQSLTLGTEVQTRLVGQPVTGAVYEFAPVIDTFLKAHLFGDIFGRGVLSDRQRELVTIGALASLGGVDDQLAGHFRIGLRVGLSREQLRGVASAIGEDVSSAEGRNAQRVLDQVLSQP